MSYLAKRDISTLLEPDITTLLLQGGRKTRPPYKKSHRGWAHGGFYI